MKTTFGVDRNNGKVVVVKIIQRWRKGRRREGKEEVNRWCVCVCGVGVFVNMLTMVALCEKTNLNPLLWVKFYGLDHMFRRGLVA